MLYLSKLNLKLDMCESFLPESIMHVQAGLLAKNQPLSHLPTFKKAVASTKSSSFTVAGAAEEYLISLLSYLAPEHRIILFTHL